MRPSYERDLQDVLKLQREIAHRVRAKTMRTKDAIRQGPTYALPYVALPDCYKDEA